MIEYEKLLVLNCVFCWYITVVVVIFALKSFLICTAEK